MIPVESTALSVIICTHNPRLEYLSRTLDALREQTLSSDQWELLVIDNGSTPPVLLDLSWHPRGRSLREETIGLIYARICGIRESSGDLLVFVDDDNLLDCDYLVHALEIAHEWPILGTWGGQCVPEFERTPEEWTRKYWKMIGIRTFEHDRWSNLPYDSGALPWGAGMCLRRSVANAYVTQLKNDPIRRGLGRVGTRLFADEDADLCLTACCLGLGNGIFSALRLTHLIPARRLEESYLLELVEAMTYSAQLLNYSRGMVSPCRPSRSQRLLSWYQSLWVPERERQFDSAYWRGKEAAIKEIERLNDSDPKSG